MFGFIKRFIEFESRLQHLQDKLDFLEVLINDVKAERDEFKQILFKRAGLIVEEGSSSTKELPRPVIPVKSWARHKVELEIADREKRWANKEVKSEVAESPMGSEK